MAGLVQAPLVAERPALRLARRVITRPSDAGGEAFDGVSAPAFDQMSIDGVFALQWHAHGLRYGIPAATLAPLAAGEDVLVNLSRSILREAQARFPGFAVVSLTAAPAVLAARLKQRGRESADEIEQRLSRADFALPDGLSRIVHLDNGGALADTVAAFFAAFYPSDGDAVLDQFTAAQGTGTGGRRAQSHVGGFPFQENKT